jgi:hypothetical protein
MNPGDAITYTSFSDLFDASANRTVIALSLQFEIND